MENAYLFIYNAIRNSNLLLQQTKTINKLRISYDHITYVQQVFRNIKLILIKILKTFLRSLQVTHVVIKQW